MSGASVNDFALSYAGNLLFATSVTERMRITSDGKVDIGTASPDSLLHIEDDYSLTKHLLHVKGGGSSGAYGVLVETANGTDLFKIDTLSYKVSIPSGYPVGIGTPDPAALLHIQHATAPNIRIERNYGCYFRKPWADRIWSEKC